MVTTPPIDALLTFFPVQDIARTHAFYHEALGLPFVYEAGGCRIYRVTGGGYVGFCARAGAAAIAAPEGGPRVVLTLVSDDVDGWHRRMTEHGVEPDGPPRDHAEYGIRHFFAPDPDGWLVEVQRFLDPAWAIPIEA